MSAIQICVLLFWVLAATVALLMWRRHKSRRSRLVARHRIPSKWPLKLRCAASAEECLAWAWLCDVFPEQHVVLKLPVTRFTAAIDPQQNRDWYHMLSGVHCLFTVCAPNGRVMGCVDLHDGVSNQGRDRSLKQSLLTQLNVPYYSLRIGQRSGAETLRKLFLNVEDIAETVPVSPTVQLTTPRPSSQADPERDRYQAEIIEIRQKLRTVVARGREVSRSSGFGALGDSSGAPLTASDEFAPVEYEDSDFQSSDFIVRSALVY